MCLNKRIQCQAAIQATPSCGVKPCRMQLQLLSHKVNGHGGRSPAERSSRIPPDCYVHGSRHELLQRCGCARAEGQIMQGPARSYHTTPNLTEKAISLHTRARVRYFRAVAPERSRLARLVSGERGYILQHYDFTVLTCQRPIN